MAGRRLSPYLAWGLLIAAGCSPLPAAPPDFPEPPMTVIVEFPTTLPPTPTPRPIIKPIFADDMADARTFFLILKVAMSAGDTGLIAERASYPLEVRANGQPMTIRTPEELERNYDSIFSWQLQEAILAAEEDDVLLQVDGVKAAGGALWFQQFCRNPACTQGEFRITQINN